MNIDFTELIIGICSLVITAVIIPLVRAAINKLKIEAETKLSKEEREIIYEVAETAVRWAKQWLQSESGEMKKAQVMAFLITYLEKVGIKTDAEYLDKIVEGIYEQVKNEVTNETAGAIETTQEAKEEK